MIFFSKLINNIFISFLSFYKFVGRVLLLFLERVYMSSHDFCIRISDELLIKHAI